MKYAIVAVTMLGLSAPAFADQAKASKLNTILSTQSVAAGATAGAQGLGSGLALGGLGVAGTTAAIIAVGLAVGIAATDSASGTGTTN